MEKGRFTKVRRLNNYLELETSQNSYGHIFIPCEKPILSEVYDYYCFRDEDDNYERPTEEIKVTDFVNSLCFKILDSYGLEYDEENNRIEHVVYTWDSNLIPGERFIGIKLEKIDGTEESIQDLFPNITMDLDILDSFRFDSSGYKGFHGNYRLYLPYSEEGLKIYQEYLEYKISKRFSNNLKRKIKI